MVQLRVRAILSDLRSRTFLNSSCRGENGDADALPKREEQNAFDTQELGCDISVITAEQIGDTDGQAETA